jgi:hypothetical protein
MPDYFTLLRDRVTLKCRSIDRIFLQAFVPKLQSVGQVCIFLRWRRKFRIPSSAAFGKIGETYVQAIHEFAKSQGIPVVRFQKGQNKENVARPFLQAAAREGRDRVVLIGIAQEKASIWRPGKRRVRRRPLIPTWSGVGRWLM